MPCLRYSAFLLVSSILITPALAKDESLVDRGKRMCEDAGIPLSECSILPPGDRGVRVQRIATSSSETAVGDEAPFGTGTYGWCDECTSFFAAAPVKPWTEFGGREFRPLRDEDDDRPSARLDSTAEGGAQGGSGGGSGGAGSNGGSAGSGGKGDRGVEGKGGSGGRGKGDRGRGGKGGSGGGKSDRGNGGKGGSSGGKGGSGGKGSAGGRW